MAPQRSTVIVIGAGPVGLFAGLRMAKAGLNVRILEALPAVEKSPRAMVYQPVAVKEMDKTGILEDCRKIGSQGRTICWRKLDGEVIAELKRIPTPEHPYENLVIGQHLLAGIILEHFNRCEDSEILFDRKLTAIEQRDDGVVVTTQRSDGSQETFEADHVVGADGGRSAVRKLIGVEWEGLTWPEQLVACNVWYDFEKYGFQNGNFICDKEHYALIANIDPKGLWRVAYGELDGLTTEQIRERLDWKFNKLFPGPKPVEYKLEMFSPYKIHQRCASSFKVGRVLLAGDAAHLCAPFGGLGLTGGLLDAAAVADSFILLHSGKASAKILDQYAESRRQIFTDVVNPITTANKRRLHEYDIDTLGDTDPFLAMVRKADAEQQQTIRSHTRLAVEMQDFIEVAGGFE